MRRVCDQLPLRACGFLERAEHRIEARGETAELVATAGVDPLGEVACRGDGLSGRGQPSHRRERRPGDDQAEPGRKRDPRTGNQNQIVLDPAQGMVDLGQRSRDLHGETRRIRERDHAYVRAVDLRVHQKRPPAVTSDSLHPAGDGQSKPRAAREHVARCADDLRIAGRAAELRGRHSEMVEVAYRGLRQLSRGEAVYGIRIAHFFDDGIGRHFIFIHLDNLTDCDRLGLFKSEGRTSAQRGHRD